MLTAEEGEFLVKLARRTIEDYLYKGTKPPVPPVSPKLRERRGVFVTLMKGGELRGCIGRPQPDLPLVKAIMDSAISSAVEDPRFLPLTTEELPEVVVEVSVLTPPELIKVKDPRDYVKQVKVGKHGLIVECMGRAGLLLPQVAVEWGWDAEDFLSHTCMKAGLTPDSWLRGDARISRFSAQIFAEESPGGAVKERKLKDD